MSVTYVIDATNILEIVEEQAPDLTDDQKDKAAEAILSELEGGAACLNSLAAFLVEQTGIDVADFAEED